MFQHPNQVYEVHKNIKWIILEYGVHKQCNKGEKQYSLCPKLRICYSFLGYPRLKSEIPFLGQTQCTDFLYGKPVLFLITDYAEISVPLKMHESRT